MTNRPRLTKAIAEGSGMLRAIVSFWPAKPLRAAGTVGGLAFGSPSVTEKTVDRVVGWEGLEPSTNGLKGLRAK
jgi:hypothetical protein